MGDEIGKKFTLEEYVFRDIRKLEKTWKGSYKWKVKNALADPKNDPVDKVSEYQSITKAAKKLDAERWEIALDSYKNYPYFRDNDYVIESDCLCYKKGNTRIRISADTLTGPSELIEQAKNLGLRNHEALKEFCSVVYTVGNCCPVMFNPLPKAIGIKADTCWLKLQRFINPGKENYQTIQEYNWNDDLRYRGKGLNTKDNMFGLFSEPLSGKEIIERLRLNDYYNDDYNLIIKKTPQEYANLGVDAYIDFLRLVTSLIIKRGIRIYRKNDLSGIDIDKLADKIITRKKAEISGKTEFD